MYRFFIIHYIEVLNIICKLNSSARICKRMKLNNYIKIIAAFTNCLYTRSYKLKYLIGKLSAESPVRLLICTLPVSAGAYTDRINFNRCIPLSHRFLCSLRILIWRSHIFVLQIPVKLNLAGISAETFICFTSKHLIYRHIEIFSLDIPKSNINCAHSCINHCSAAHTPEGCTE